ncbi:carbonic anhydrase [Phreatobacter cathodiphilus]|uniref:carbonic anhydrase n=1 Tax=Phreatobacter cathodiphilus TaxID=1868589 RepID=A0A2S0N6N5_9HYPH|nr:carbonic anhydrase [Phreatobacter cathodiphilus]AVO43824.1 carbonic anhydrase [Phreatobacter cathodiphilus]
MCRTCDSRLDRRTLLGAAGLAMAAGLSAAGKAFAAEGPGSGLTPDQALDKLKQGNRRYVADAQSCVMDMARRRNETAGGQAPWATLVSCADSRVPPELIFGGLTLGELFVVRNAGNTVDTTAMGTLEYGAAVLKSPLIVVLGHSGCGAVAAACDVVAKNATFPGAIGPMIEPIVPAALAARGRQGDFIDNTVRENVRRTVAKLTSAGPIIAEAVKAGAVKIVGARYDLATGAVDVFA